MKLQDLTCWGAGEDEIPGSEIKGCYSQLAGSKSFMFVLLFFPPHTPRKGPEGCWWMLCSYLGAPNSGNLFHYRTPAKLCSPQSGRSWYVCDTGLWANLPSTPESCRAVHYTNILDRRVWNRGEFVLLLVKTDMQKWEVQGEMLPNNRLSSKKLFVIQNMFSKRNSDLVVDSGLSP